MADIGDMGCFCDQMRAEGYCEVCPHCIATKDWSRGPTPVELTAMTPTPKPDEDWLEAYQSAVSSLAKNELAEWEMDLLRRRVEARIEALTKENAVLRFNKRADEADELLARIEADQRRITELEAALRGATNLLKLLQDLHDDIIIQGDLDTYVAALNPKGASHEQG